MSHTPAPSENDTSTARGIIFQPPHHQTPPSDWTPIVGSSAPAVPLQGLTGLYMSPTIEIRGTQPDVLHGREIRLTFDTHAFVPLFGAGIMQNQPNNGWANLHCALCPLEQFTSFMHDHQRNMNGALAIFTARNHGNLPNPCRGIVGNGSATFSIFVALPDWNKICHFDVEIMHGAAYAQRVKFTQRLRHLPGHPVQFV